MMAIRPSSSIVKEEFFSADTDCIVESIKSSDKADKSCVAESRTPRLIINNDELTFEKQGSESSRARQAAAVPCIQIESGKQIIEGLEAAKERAKKGNQEQEYSKKNTQMLFEEDDLEGFDEVELIDWREEPNKPGVKSNHKQLATAIANIAAK